MKQSFRIVSVGLIAAGLQLLVVPKAPAQAAVPNDQEIVDQAASYSLEKLVELLGVYDRLDKRQVTGALADEILKRDPNNASALAVKEGRPVASGIEPDSGGGAETATDRLANEVESLQGQRRFGELISLLNRSKKDYQGEAFPFQDDLADAYFESGDLGAAKAAYSEMANSSKYASAERELARKSLRDIDDFERLAKAQELSKAGDHAGALAIIDEMKAARGGGSFPYENERGDILFASGDLDGAEAIYQRVADGGGYDSAQRADARDSLRDVAKGRRLLAAHVLLREKRPDEAMAIADELEKGGWKNDEDVQLLRAEVMVEQGRLDEAITMLTGLKEKSYKGAAFPGQDDLASAYYRSNRLRDAASAYSEIIDGNYLATEKAEATLDLRDISREINGSIAFDLGYVSEDEGDTWHSSLVVKSPIYADGLRYWAFARRDDLELSGERSLLAGSGERFEGGLAIEKFIDQNLSVAGYLGGSESDNGDSDQFLFGGSFNQRVGRGHWGLDFAYNERAIDSIALQVLDGRQHRLQANFDVPVTHRLNLEGFAYYRQVEALGDEIGDGFGSEIDLLYTVVEAEKNSPAIRIGYAGEYHKFEGNQLSGDRFGPFLRGGAADAAGLAYDLVEEEINLHGLKLVVEGRLHNKVSYFVSGAAQYDFFDKQLQYSAATGLEFYVSERSRLTTGVEYYSAGQTSSSAAGVVLGTVGLSISF